MARPPQVFLRFFQWFCHPALRNYIEGDLLELYNERFVGGSKRKADLKFAMDVMLLFRPSIIRPAGGFDRINNYGMLKNYFKVGVRNILKYKVFSFINVFGLALAMSVSMLIILMLADQRRYDAFHEQKDNIYRILSNVENSRQPYATTPYPLATALKADYPIVKEATRLTPGIGGDAVYGQRRVDMRGYFTDPSFFQVFSFELVKGDKRTALEQPNAMIITQELAVELFGGENPLGKTIDFVDRGLPFPQDFDGVGTPPVSWGSFTITGVLDERNYTSHLRFDVLVSSSSLPVLYAEKKVEDRSSNWEWYFRTYTYVLLNPEKSDIDLTRALNDFVGRIYANIKAEQTKGFTLRPQKLMDVQLGLAGNDTNNRMPRIGYYFLSILAIVIMVSACLNYTNLSIARALTRAKEIGVRKVTGATRKNLLFQFLSESIIMSVLALMLAILLLIFIRPAFKGLWVNNYLEFELPDSFAVYAAFLVFALLIGVLAGVYPALYLSKYQPLKALKNNEGPRGQLVFRKFLSVSQFVIAFFFITTSVLIFNQFKHFLEFDYGFTAKNIVNVELQGFDVQRLSTAFRALPGISSVSASDIIPATGRSNGIALKRFGGKDEYVQGCIMLIDEQFVPNLDLKIVAGKNLPLRSQSTDRYILVNEDAVKKLGYAHPVDILGEVFETKWGLEPVEVIGVVGDFRYKLLINEDAIGPLVMQNREEGLKYLNVKVASDDLMGTVHTLEATWKQLDPIHPFKYEFFDDQLEGTHAGLLDVVSILGFIAFLAIVIACLGLLGMATYAAERRTREVGIRKILGAEELGIAWLLSSEFFRMLAISIFIAAPLTYFLNNLWLQRFPNRVEFGFGTVFIGVVVLAVLGLITIGSQTVRASRGNPVDSLKME